LGKVVAYVLLFPWTLPYWLCEGGGMRGDTTREFAYERYPYADGGSGALHPGPYVDTQFDKPWLDGTPRDHILLNVKVARLRFLVTIVNVIRYVPTLGKVTVASLSTGCHEW